ncbi:hypothetical protein [Maritimibacter sp. 55A14]|uniref:hypothetical protein n=1 Tax=Maritimibacter sp. 55A14 TaxID=2174844 RepID=UPI0011B2546F|nr:hypothetical protein [Maritimibacter sp. 55A14]
MDKDRDPDMAEDVAFLRRDVPDIIRRPGRNGRKSAVRTASKRGFSTFTCRCAALRPRKVPLPSSCCPKMTRFMSSLGPKTALMVGENGLGMAGAAAMFNCISGTGLLMRAIETRGTLSGPARKGARP